MEKNEIIYRTYKRYHTGDNCLELEENKIVRDERLSAQSQKKVKKKLSKLNNIEIDDDMIDDIANSIYEEERRKRNSNTHKERLKELKKNKDFS